jgi:hypothetical protein
VGDAEPQGVRLTDWAEIARYHRAAERLAQELMPQLEGGRSLHWDHLKVRCDQNLTVWKLLLRSLRQRGFDIGSHDEPYVRTSGRRRPGARGARSPL